MLYYVSDPVATIKFFHSLLGHKGKLLIILASGAVDLQMLSKLQLKHPGASVNNEIVEPSSEQIHNYKVLVAKTPNLENVSFNWNKMTSSEYENHVKEKKENKKFDFIHMIQMLYYVSDPVATIKFFHSLLGHKGKLLIILASGAVDLQMLSKLQLKHPGASVNNEIVEPSSEQIHNYKGAVDLQMLSKLQLKHPGASVNNEIVEPSSEQIHNYKVLVAKTPNLENVSFNWNKMTSSEYENHVKEKKENKKFDFIHMIQMLYYVSDPAATIKFFHSLLGHKGKLLIILVSGTSGWSHLWKRFKHQLCFNEFSQYITTQDIKEYLDSTGLKYQHYDLPSYLDITECFTEGDEKGELLMDFLTETCEFNKTAPPDLKAEIMSFLRQPECTTEKDGKIIFNNTLGAIVVEP
ncbi:UNVERIFIED_CONTAM: hypothetical protein FKN15_062760 [Acipenser sinensis]